MTKCAFRIDAVPVAQPRQRHRVVKAGGRTFTQNYTPKRDPVNEFKHAVREAFLCHASPPWPLDQPIEMQIRAWFPRPKTKTRKTRPNPRFPKTSKPDVDNLAKAIMDALQGFAYRDDSQVYCLSVTKEVSAGDEMPGVSVVIIAGEVVE